MADVTAAHPAREPTTDPAPDPAPDPALAGAGLLAAPVLEHATLQVRPGRAAAFEAAMREALPLVSAAPGFRGARVSRNLDRPDTYLLLVGWASVAAHEQGFRGSAPYERWRALLHPFYDPHPVVEHHVAVLGADPAPGAAAGVRE
jgi:heme-degrading monooxygenase HmoA